MVKEDKKLTSNENEQENKLLPGSSQPQDLGSISYKDTEIIKEQQIQSVETTSTIVTETFQAEEKYFQKKRLLKSNMNLQLVS